MTDIGESVRPARWKTMITVSAMAAGGVNRIDKELRILFDAPRMSSQDVRRRNTEQSPDQERASNDYDTVDQAGLYVLAAKYGDVITQRGLKEERRNSCGDIFFALGRNSKESTQSEAKRSTTDAIEAVERKYELFDVKVVPVPDASAEAAVVAAGYTALSGLFPQDN